MQFIHSVSPGTGIATDEAKDMNSIGKKIACNSFPGVIDF